MGCLIFGCSANNGNGFTYASLLSLWAVVGSAKMDNNAFLDYTTHGQVFHHEISTKTGKKN